jgi:hypothetical protein
MNVTPDKEAPIIPKATKYQGDCRLAVKKVSVVAPREVSCEIRMRTRKYAPIIDRTSNGDMLQRMCFAAGNPKNRGPSIKPCIL